MTPVMRQLVGAETADGRLETLADLESFYATGTPWLRADFVAAVDGAAEIGGRSAPLGSPADLEAFVVQRSLSDAVVAGASTARVEDYGPIWLRPELRDHRAERGQPPLPALVVVSGTARLDPKARMFVERRADQPEPPPTVVVTCGAADKLRVDALRQVATVLVCGDDAVDLTAAVDQLRRLGYGRMVCEGGPTLFSGLLEAGMVDELCVTRAPLLAGPGHRTMAGSGPALPSPVRLDLTALAIADGALFARYGVLPPAGDGEAG